VAVGTSPSQAPTFTWQPYVSASGQYDLSFRVVRTSRIVPSVHLSKSPSFPAAEANPGFLLCHNRFSLTRLHLSTVVPSSPHPQTS
jgi:hypothetical protein